MTKAAIEKSDDALVLELLKHLQALGVTLLLEWDVLAFLYSHASSLCTAAQIAKLIGCDKGDMGGALRKLEALGLIQRSRDSQGIRLYELSMPLEAGRHSSLLELMSLAQNRTGRLLLLKHLKSPAAGARTATEAR